MKLYPACWRPVRNPPCPGNPTHSGPRLPTRPPSAALAPAPRRASRPRPLITFNHREPTPTTETAPTSALHLFLHLHPPGRQACTTMPHLPILPPCRAQSAPFAAIATICPPAPLIPCQQLKKPKNNHRHRWTGRSPPRANSNGITQHDANESHRTANNGFPDPHPAMPRL